MGMLSRLLPNLFLALAIAGCSSEPTPMAPLRVASSPWPGYEPFYLARDLGYFGADKVDYFELPSADITLESFRNRSADIATLTLEEVLDLVRGGTKLRVLLVMDSSNGADAAMATPTVKSLADLKGKRVAITNIPLGIYMLSRLLDKAGLAHEDIDIITLAENKHEEYYRQGKADVVITMEPYKSQIAALGAHAIFDSSHIPREIFDLLVVHEDVFQKRRNDVCHFARQWYRALDYLHANPDDAHARMSKRLGKTVREFRTMLDGIVLPTREESLRMVGGTKPEILETAKRLNEVMVRAKQLPGPVDITTSLDPAIQSCIQ